MTAVTHVSAVVHTGPDFGTLIDIGRPPDWNAALMRPVASRPANVGQMAWLMPRMAKALPHLGDIVIAATKPR